MIEGQYAAFDCTERKEFEEVQSIFENIWNHAIERRERKAISGRQEHGDIIRRFI